MRSKNNISYHRTKKEHFENLKSIYPSGSYDNGKHAEWFLLEIESDVLIYWFKEDEKN